MLALYLSIVLSTSACMRPNTFKLLRLEILPAPRKKLSHLCLFRGGVRAGGWCVIHQVVALRHPQRRAGVSKGHLTRCRARCDPLGGCAGILFISHAHFLCGLACILCQSRPRRGASSPIRGRSLFETSATTVEWSCKM